MKRTLLGVFILVLEINTFAQTNTSYQISNSKWKDVLSTCWVNSTTYKEEYSYIFHEIVTKGDTVFNDTIYLKLYENDLYAGALRQDSCKIYYRSETNKDQILYDFCVKDKFYSPFFKKEFEVVFIDSVLIDNSLRKRIYFDDELGVRIGKFWIEGVGSSGGLLKPISVTDRPTCDLCCGVEQTLICYSQNDELMYINNNYYDCDSLIMGTKEISSSSNEIKVYPNPTTGKFTIENITDRKITDIDIFSIEGRLIISKLHTKIHAPNFYLKNPGTYILRISTANEVICKRVVVK